MAKFNAGSYAKNVLKSAGYISVGTIKGINPSMTSFVSQNISSVKDMYENVKDFKYNAKENMSKFVDSEYAKFGKELASNLVEDLKSGKFYNPERQSKYEDQYMDNLGFSMDDEDYDWGDSEDKESPVTANTVQSVGNMIISSNGATVDRATRKILAGHKASTSALLNFNREAFGKVNVSLAAINSSILGMHDDIAKPLNAHIQNSTTFFKTTTDQLAKQTALLEHIDKLLTDRFEPKKKSGFNSVTKRSSNRWNDVFSGDLPDLSEWAKGAKSNMSNVTDSVTALMAFKEMFSPEMLQNMKIGGEYASPVATLISMALSAGFRQTSWGKSMNRANTDLKKLGAGLVSRMQRRAGDGTLFGLLSSIFNIAPESKSKFSTGQYNKGRQDWTGKDAKALREVIPMQLAQILSALTGEDAKIFNYDTGRWETMTGIYKRYQTARKNATINNDSYDVKALATREYAKANNLSRSDRRTKTFEEDYNRFMMIMASKDISPDISREGLERYLNSKGFVGTGANKINKDNLNMILNIIYGPNTRVRSTFASAAYGARASHSDLMDKWSTGDDVGINALRNGSGMFGRKGRSSIVNTSIMDSTDNKGKTLSFYLQHYFDRMNDIVALLSTADRDTKNRIARSLGVNVNTLSGTGTDTSSLDSKRRTNKQGSKSTNRIQRERAKKAKAAGITEAEAAGYSDDDWYDIGDLEVKNPNSVDKLIDWMNDAFYGQNRDKYSKGYGRGLLDIILGIPADIGKSIKDQFDDWKKKLDDFFQNSAVGRFVKGKWDQFKGSEFAARMKNTYKGAANWTKDAAKSTVSKAGGAFDAILENTFGDNRKGTASRGGYVRKSGMVSVSEGEFIIPAELNPYYHGRINKSSQRATESRNRRAWLNSSASRGQSYWGSYADGGEVDDGKNKSLLYAAIDGLGFVTNKLYHFVKDKEAPAFADETKRRFEKSKLGKEVDKIKGKAKGLTRRNSGARNVSTYFTKLGKSAKHSAEVLFGEGAVDDTKKTVKDVLGMIKPYLPETLAGGSIGALVGAAATGSPIGLFGGLILGSGISLVKNSSSFSKWLFGTEDEYGEFKGGKLPPNLSKFLKKQFPGMAKSGAIGAGLGALGFAPGGLMGGFILGAGLDLLGSTNQFKDVMFGHEGADGVRRGGIVGSIKMRVIDPMADYVNRAIAGAGDFIKENIANPLKRLFDPLADFTKSLIKNAFDTGYRFITGAINDHVIQPLAEKFDALFGPLTRFLGRRIQNVFGLGKRLVAAPFRALGAAGDALQRHNIRTGATSLTAEQRMQFEGQRYGLFKNKSFQNSQFTRILAAASPEEREQILALMPSKSRQRRDIINQERQQLSETLGASLNDGGLNNKQATAELRRLMNSPDFMAGDPEAIARVKKWVNAQVRAKNMSSSTAKKAHAAIDKSVQKINTLSLDEASFSEKQQEMSAKLGIDLSKLSKSDQKLGNVELRSLYKQKTEANKEQIAEKRNQNTGVNALTEARKDNPIEDKKISLLDKIHLGIDAIARHFTGVSTDEIQSKLASKDEEWADNADKELDRATNTNKSKRRRKAAKKKNKEDKEESVKYTDDGMKLIKGSNGYEPDLRHGATKEKIEEEKESKGLQTRFYKAFVGKNGLFSKGSSFFSGLFGKKDEKEKKQGFLSKLFSGAGSVLGSLGKVLGPLALGLGGVAAVGAGANWLDQNPEVKDRIGQIVGDIGTGITNAISTNAPKIGEALRDVITTYGPTIGKYVLEGISTVVGGLIDLMPKSLDGWFNLFKNGVGVVKEGVERTGNMVDSAQDFLSGRDTSTYAEGDYMDPYLTDNFVKTGLVRNMALRGDHISKFIKHVPIVGKPVYYMSKSVEVARKGLDNAISSKAASKAVTKVTEAGSNLALKGATKLAEKGKLGAAGKLYNIAEKGFAKTAQRKAAATAATTAAKGAAKNVAKDAAGKAAKSGLSSTIAGVIQKVFGMFGGKKVAETAAKEAGEEVAEAVVQKGGSKILANLGKNVVWPLVMANAVTVGLQDAPSILGYVTDDIELSLSDRIIAVVAEVLNQAIPGIGGIIPTEILLGIVLNILGAIGIVDTSEIMAKRAQSQQIVDTYNATNGTTYSIREYNKNVKNDYTVQERIGKIGGKLWEGAKSAGSAVVEGAVNFGKGFVNAAKDVGTAAKNFGSEAWKGIKNVGSAIGKGVTDFGKGFLNAGKDVIDKGKNFVSATKEGLANLGSKVSTKASELLSGAKEKFIDIATIGKNIKDKADAARQAGDLKALFTLSADSSDGDDKETGGMNSIISSLYANTFKYTYALPTTFNALKNTVSDLFRSIKELDIGDTVKKLWEYSDPSKHNTMDGYDQIIDNAKKSAGDGIFGGLNSTILSIIGPVMKGIVSIVRPFKTIGNVIGDAVGWIGDKLGFGGNDDTSTTNDDGGGFFSKLFGGSSGVHVTQKGSNRRFGRSTVDQNGCGPAVAATVLRSYGKGANLDDMVTYAQYGGYVAGSSGVGTRASYFRDVLGRNGISTSYVANKNQINRAVGSGNPTVLLGQDSSNRSKSNSPFGPNPHYVVARGRDRYGNIIVDDPELDGTAIYNNNILNHAKLGIMTGGGAMSGATGNVSTTQTTKKKTSESTDIIGRRGMAADKKEATSSSSSGSSGSSATTTTVTPTVSTDGDYIGKYVKKFESGSKGSSAISSGTGDYGGVSFGSYQFPSYKKSVTTEGNLPAFWNKYYASQYPGVQPGNNEAFKKAWLDAVSKDPTGFFNNEHAFIASQYYTPAVNKLVEYGVGDPGKYDRSAQEAIWSSAVQLGPGSAAKLFRDAGVSNSMSAAEYINKVYDRKYNTVDSKFKSSSKSVRDSIRGRYTEERQIISGLVGQNPIDPNTTSGVSSSGGTTGSSSSSGSSGFDLGSMIDAFLGKAFTTVASSIGGVAGKIIGMIFGNATSGNTSGNSFALSSGSNSAQENAIMSKVGTFLGYKMNYSQAKRYDYRPNGNADCSSTVQGILKQSINVDPGGDTGAQISSSKGRVVDVNTGSGPNEANLRPGDLLFYKRSSSKKPKGVGHVEMYVGDGQRIGHGGSTASPFGLAEDGKHGRGPFPSALSTDASRYIEAHRFTTNSGTTTSNNGNMSGASDGSGMTATGSGIVRTYDFTKKRYGGASNLVTTAAQVATSAYKSTTGKPIDEIGKIIELLTTIATNTANNAVLPELVALMQNYLQIASTLNSNTGSSSPRSKDIKNDVNQQIDMMRAKLTRIAQTL